MNNKEIGFDVFENSDVNTIEEIGTEKMNIDKNSRDRMLKITMDKYAKNKKELGITEKTAPEKENYSDEVTSVEKYSRSKIRQFVYISACSAAAVALIAGSVFMLGHNKKSNKNVQDPLVEVTTSTAITSETVTTTAAEIKSTENVSTTGKYDVLARLLQRISNETTVQWRENPSGDPQFYEEYDTIVRYYTITDIKSMIDELNSLEWEACQNSEVENATGHWEQGGYYISDGLFEFGDNGYNGIVNLYPKGYIRIEDTNSIYYYFKLKNESDAEKITQMAEKYFVMDESSKIAEKICNGITNFDNLKAHYTYNLSRDGVVEKSISGDLSVDAKNNKMYMTDEGTFLYVDEIYNIKSEIIMNGHDDSANWVLNKDTGKYLNFPGTYHYRHLCGDGVCPKYHYIYFCKDIEKSLTPNSLNEYLLNNFTFEINEVDGNTEILYRSPYDDPNERTRILLTPNGQLISYEGKKYGSKTSFKLDDYVFDSPDFTMEDTASVYEKIMNTNEVSDR